MRYLLIAFLLLSVSCEKLEKLLMVPITLDEEFDIVLPATALTAFNGTYLINAASNDQVKAYLGKIKGYTVKSIEYAVVTPETRGVTLVNGVMGFGTVLVTIPVFDLSKTAVYKLQFSVDQLAQIGTDLASGNDISFGFAGSVDRTPVNAKIKVTLKLDLKVI